MAALPRIYPTVVHMLSEAAQKSPDREALVSETDRLTYRQYWQCVCGFAEELRLLGAPGERVALIMTNSADICIAIFAAHMARMQVVPLNPAYTVHELEPMIDEARPCVLVYDDAIADRIWPLGKNLDSRHRIRIGDRTGRRLTRWMEHGDSDAVDMPHPDDFATLQYTGGTTGRAKGINIIHNALSVNISQREALVPTRVDTERLLCAMPLFHCYAVAMGLHNMAYCRGTLVLLKRYHPADLLATLNHERITLFSGTPTLFTSLMGYPGFEAADLTHLHASYSGAGPLPADLLRRWESVTHAPVIEGYGQSEAGPVISFNPMHGVRKPGSVGLPVPKTQLEIVSDETDTCPLPIGSAGEIRIQGPQIMTGYLNRDAETRHALRNGWLYTGDIGELDDDGYLYIRGRKKELIIVSGYNVYPNEVANALMLHPSVREAAVVSRSDDYRGEVPVAFVALHAEAHADVDMLRAHCKTLLAEYKVPAEFHVLNELPKTPVGKLDKRAMRACLIHAKSTRASKPNPALRGQN